MADGVCVIFTNARDVHACSVDHVLYELGQRTAVVNTAAIPSGQSISVDYDDDIAFRVGDIQFHLSEVKASWNRRFSKLFKMPSNVHEADVHHIRDNCTATLTGMAELMDDRFPVNPLRSGRIKANKLVQLKVASRAGFRTPKTIVSNNYEDIIAFLSKVESACVKSYNAHGWRAGEAIFQAMTTRISASDDISRASFEISPHIYQQFIGKIAEYRLVMFGRFSACVKIDSNSLVGSSQVDWRSDPTYLSVLSMTELPASVLASARSMMKTMELRFAIFDLAETNDGEFVFFEVNESGQWLWQELHCPERPILQPFAEFLTSGSDDFEWDERQRSAELSASIVCPHVEGDPKYAGILLADFPDQPAFMNDERLSARAAQSQPPHPVAVARS